MTGVPVCRIKVRVRAIEQRDGKLPVPLTGDIKDINTGCSVRVPGAVRVSSQDTVTTGQIPATEGCGWLDNTRVWPSVQGSSLEAQSKTNFQIKIQLVDHFGILPDLKVTKMNLQPQKSESYHNHNSVCDCWQTQTQHTEAEHAASTDLEKLWFCCVRHLPGNILWWAFHSTSEKRTNTHTTLHTAV